MSETDETTPEEQVSPSPKPTRKASRRKVAPRKTESVDRESSDDSAEAPTVEEEQLVRIVNQLGQLLEVSVLTEDGQQIGVRLGPHEKTDPLLPSRITDYTQRLISRGYLSVTNS